MNIGIFHGYELIGSGSNQATSYLAKTLKELGYNVSIICREPNPKVFDYIDQIIRWDTEGNYKLVDSKKNSTESENGKCTLHQLTLPPINAVYITDTQRPGNVKAFNELSDLELSEYHNSVVNDLRIVLKQFPVDILQCNHLIYQPVAAMHVCPDLNIPFIINPRGSAIEYTIRHDERFKKLAREAITSATGLIIGNTEVRDRIINLYPEIKDQILDKTSIVGLGVDVSLFLPINKKDRLESINKISIGNINDGKTEQLSDELFSRLEDGDLDAITDYRNSYNVKKPDANFFDKLSKIPWDENILLFVGATIVGKGLQSIIVALPFIIEKYPNTHFIIVGAGASREIFESLIWAISNENDIVLDYLVDNGYDLDPVELTGSWTDIKSFLSNSTNKKDLFQYGKNLTNHIHFLGRLDHNYLRYLFPCSDIGLFPSIIPEAYGNVIFESLANGVLPMASYFSGLACNIDDLSPHLGKELTERIKIPVDDNLRIKMLIQNLCYLLENSVSEKLSPKLREIAINEYDWVRRGRQMVNSYSGFYKTT